jgi:hypothetical protein
MVHGIAYIAKLAFNEQLAMGLLMRLYHFLCQYWFAAYQHDYSDTALFHII